MQRAQDDARLLEAVADLIAAVEVAVLERKGLIGAELRRSQARVVDAEVRRLAVAEVEVALGFSVTEARHVVAVVSSGSELLGLVMDALRRGEVSWWMVRSFWDRTASLGPEARLLVAWALFGKDAATAAEERLDPDGELRVGPWPQSCFDAALGREVEACRGQDVAGEREARRRAYARRRASVRLHEDGTATLSVTGPAATVVAAGQRVDRCARVLRRAGDSRTLQQLRADVTEALLLYGTFALPSPAPDAQSPDSTSPEPPSPAPSSPATTGSTGPAGSPTVCPAGTCAAGRCSPESCPGIVDDVLAPEDLEHLARVINAQPAVQLQVVVPVDTLRLGFPICSGCAQRLDIEDQPATVVRPRPESGPDRRSTREPGEDSALDLDPYPDPGPPGRGLVGEALGPSPFFLSPGHARELALLPGTTMHRLLVDPADGRLVERSIAAYRPDAEMRRQVLAADVYSRTPGSRLGGHAGELDHVTPYGWAGGPTSEVNLALLARQPHRFKTQGYWHLSLGARRDLTVTTVLDQIVTTRVHDYRQYLHVRDAEDLDDRRDRANRLTYAASAQDPRTRLGRAGDGYVTVTHVGPDGSRRPGPHPDHPTLDDLLGHD